jgi:hypothetical protein
MSTIILTGILPYHSGGTFRASHRSTLSKVVRLVIACEYVFKIAGASSITIWITVAGDERLIIGGERIDRRQVMIGTPFVYLEQEVQGWVISGEPAPNSSK